MDAAGIFILLPDGTRIPGEAKVIWPKLELTDKVAGELHLTLTHEGIIFDAVSDDNSIIGSSGETVDEILGRITEVEVDEDVGPDLKAIAASMTDTKPSSWEDEDGPASGVGVDYWLVNTQAKKCLLANCDQGEWTYAIQDVVDGDGATPKGKSAHKGISLKDLLCDFQAPATMTDQAQATLEAGIVALMQERCIKALQLVTPIPFFNPDAEHPTLVALALEEGELAAIDGDYPDEPITLANLDQEARGEILAQAVNLLSASPATH